MGHIRDICRKKGPRLHRVLKPIVWGNTVACGASIQALDDVGSAVKSSVKTQRQTVAKKTQASSVNIDLTRMLLSICLLLPRMYAAAAVCQPQFI